MNITKLITAGYSAAQTKQFKQMIASVATCQDIKIRRLPRGPFGLSRRLSLEVQTFTEEAGLRLWHVDELDDGSMRAVELNAKATLAPPPEAW